VQITITWETVGVMLALVIPLAGWMFSVHGLLAGIKEKLTYMADQIKNVEAEHHKLFDQVQTNTKRIDTIENRNGQQ